MNKRTFICVDGHTCGNPIRVIKSGHPPLIGKTMSEKRQHFIKEFDWIRRGLMFEPRGHDLMSGSFLYPPHDSKNDVAVLFIETSGALPMCGHGTIGTVTIGIEEGLIVPKTPGKVKIEAPAGLIEVDYEKTEGKVNWVKIRNVKSYLAATELSIPCPSLGNLIFDVAYGGNFYGIIDPQKNFSGIQDFTASEIVSYSQVIRERINNKYLNQFIHPEDESIREVTHLMWTGTPINPDAHGRNAVFYGKKAIDRSPCGTGTAARMAQLYAKGRLKKEVEFIHESFIGSTFVGRIEEETMLGSFPAVIPSIRGWAKIYGYNTITIDEQDDPYAHGFSVI